MNKQECQQHFEQCRFDFDYAIRNLEDSNDRDDFIDWFYGL